MNNILSNHLGCDASFVINNKAQPEKYEKTAIRLQEIGCSYWERFDAIISKDDNGVYDHPGEYGRILSEIEVLKEAIHRGCRNVLVMEDDIIFHPYFAIAWSEIVKNLESIDFDILYPYYWYRLAKHDTFNPVTLKPVRKNFAAHFLVINGKYMTTALKLYTRAVDLGICCDRVFDDLAYMLVTSCNLVGQGGSKSECGDEYRKIIWRNK